LRQRPGFSGAFGRFENKAGSPENPIRMFSETKPCFSSFQPGGGSVIKLLMQATGARLRRVFVKLHLYQTSLALLSRRPVVVPAIPKSKEIPL
jgi:hypothetical protein